MWVRNARHKSLCVAAYLLRRGAREWRRLWGRAATPKSAVPKSTVIVRKMLPLASCPVAQMNQSNTSYLLRPFFYELGHFHGDGLLPVVSVLLRVIILRQQKRVTNPGARRAAFP